MSNIAGKAFAMNIVTPFKANRAWTNKLIFWIAGLDYFQKRSFAGLETLSLIHYARWVILDPDDFPRLSPDQPKEDLKYAYMFFFSNFNGSWTQYVDSFSMAIPVGLDLLWRKSIGWPNSVPETPFNDYVIKNQVWTNYYYSAYPLASSNDVKSAQHVKGKVIDLQQGLDSISAADFRKKYDAATIDLQAHISRLTPSPVISLAYEAIEKRRRIEENEL